MSTSKSSLSRRRAIAGIGVGGLGVALATTTTRAAETMNLADHPMCGVWLGVPNPPLPDDPPYHAAAKFGADGTVHLNNPVSQVGQGGVEFVSANVGVWEPYDELTAHFTVVQTISDANGAYTGDCHG